MLIAGLTDVFESRVASGIDSANALRGGDALGARRFETRLQDVARSRRPLNHDHFQRQRAGVHLALACRWEPAPQNRIIIAG